MNLQEMIDDAKKVYKNVNEAESFNSFYNVNKDDEEMTEVDEKKQFIDPNLKNALVKIDKLKPDTDVRFTEKELFQIREALRARIEYWKS